MTEQPGTKKRAPRSPVQRALGLLTRREHSRRELVRKLQSGGATVDEAAAAVDKLASAGWQDDARFALSLVRTRASAGYGPTRIKAELSMHGLGRDVVQAALADCAFDWNAIAEDLVHRRFGNGGLGDAAARRKAADLLVRRGFSIDQVRFAMRLGWED